MKNRTDIIGMRLPDRLAQGMRNHSKVLSLLALGLLGYLLSNSVVFGVMAPFGVALCAAASREQLPFAAAGSVLGYILTFNLEGNLQYIIAVLLLFATRYLFGSLRLIQGPVAMPILAALSVLGVSMLFMAVRGYNAYDLILGLAEATLAGGGAYFFARALSVAEGLYGAVRPKRSDLSCVVITFGLATVAITPLQVGGLSVGRILAVLVVLLCARAGGEGSGAVAGITAGVAMALVDSRYAFLTGAYGIGGLLAGVFSSFGRFGCAAVFIVVNAIGVILAGGEEITLTPIYEVFVASVGYMLLPPRLLDRVRLPVAEGHKAEEGLKTLLLDKLAGASTALRDITVTTREVSRKLAAKSAGEVGQVYGKAADTVCRRCGLKSKCWQSCYNETMNAFNDLTGLLKKSGYLTAAEVPGYFAERCCKLEALLTAVNIGYADFVKREGAQRRVSQVRSVVTDQFEGMATMLDDFAAELARLNQTNREASVRTAQYFKKLGTEPVRCCCYEDDYGRLSVEVELPGYKLGRVNKIETTLALSDLVDRELDLPTQTEGERTVRLVYSEKANYTIKQAAVQRSCSSSRLCGDSYQIFHDKHGRCCAILSDGMGHGGGAAIDSAMATGLLSRLIEAGVGFDAALKMVNSAMLVKSGEESLATIDLVAVDLYTGRATFCKAGAAPSYLRKSGRAGSVESTSLPAGILTDVGFEHSGVTLHAGDLILMVSDGVTATGGDWVTPMLQSFTGDDLQSLCEEIADTARLRRVDGHEDDITVLALRVEKGI